MRSVRYMLGGGPHRIDDCVDLVRKGRPASVHLRLRTDEIVTEMYVQRGFIGEFTWEFPDGSCVCEDWYGCYRLYDPPYERDWKIRQANARLDRRLAELDALGIEVVGGQSRFSRSLLAAPSEATPSAMSISA